MPCSSLLASPLFLLTKTSSPSGLKHNKQLPLHAAGDLLNGSVTDLYPIVEHINSKDAGLHLVAMYIIPPQRHPVGPPEDLATALHIIREEDHICGIYLRECF